MIPHLAPPIWPDPQPRPGRMAATIVRNSPELFEDPAAGPELLKCRVALVGLPDDTGVELNNGRTGASKGPAAFRAALARYGVAMPVLPSLAAPTSSARPSPPPTTALAAAYPRVFDAGDVVIGRDIHETHQRVSAAAEALVHRGLLPIAIGGGHDLTFAFVRGVSAALGPMTGAYLDAHLDVRPEVGSGMPFRALIEGGFAGGLRCVGLNPLVNLHEHAEYFRGHGGVIHLSPPEVFDAGDPTRPAFVSLDMDVLDAAFAPGVSATNPCGLTPLQVETMIRSAGRLSHVRCFDIMELNPAFDSDGRTARLAAHMFLTFLRGVSERDVAPASTASPAGRSKPS